MRKGVATNQMFMYIMAIIIIGTIMIFGMKLAGNLFSSVETVDILKFKGDLESSFDSIRSNYGSFKSCIFDVPTGVTEVCFVNLNDRDGSNQLICTPEDTDEEFICGEAGEYGNSRIDPNVFVKPYSSDVDSISVGPLEFESASGNPYCYQVEGQTLYMWMQGKGNRTLLATPSSLTDKRSDYEFTQC